MSKVFIKIIAHTDEYSIPYFEGLYNGSNIDVNLTPNVWYELNDIFKFFKNDLTRAKLLSNVMTTYKFAQPSSSYDLLSLYAYYYPTKEDADNNTNLITNTELQNTTFQFKDRGLNIYFTKTGKPYDLDLNSDKTIAIVYHVGNPTSRVTNPPVVFYEKNYSDHFGVFYDGPADSVRVQNNYNDSTTYAVNRKVNGFGLLNNLPSPQEFIAYINGKKVNSATMSKAGDKLSFGRNLTFNDVVNLYLPSEVPVATQLVHVIHPENITVTPTEIPLTGGKLNIKAKENFIITGYHVWHTDVNSNEDWKKEEQNIKKTELNFDVPKFDYASSIYVSVDTQTTLPVYYNLPTIEHVTFSPTKAELGKKTTITATPDTGYTINRLTFFANDENSGERIFTSPYKNGLIDLDLTYYDKDDLNLANQTIKHSEDIKQLEYGTYVLPKINGITFTLNGRPVTSVQLGKYYNFGVELDSHYRFLDDKGKGLVLKNVDGTTTNLSVWNGISSLGVHFENYTTANQLKNAYWDVNIQKFDHSDEHEKQIPIQLELTHVTADKTSILENSTDTITLTADNGYIFDDDVIYYSYDNNYGIYRKLTEKANKQNSIKIDLTTSSYYDYNNSKNEPLTSGIKPYIKAVATSPTVKPTGTKAIDLYSMTDGELNTFMNSALLQFNSTQNGTQTSLANFLDFVNQVYRIPLNIPNDLLTPVKQVHSGKWNINVNTNQITQDHFSINFEPIKVTPHYKNANDYNSITVSLVIPFAKEIELNINDVMNNTIKITYNVDLLQGKTTIIVNNDTGTIYTNQIDISTQLEFYGLYYDKTIGGLNSTYINNVLQPYISISYHKPITNLISYSTNENGVLKDYNGFVRVSHGTLTGNMNDTEYDEIMNLLYGGIKIGTKGN